MKRFLFSLLAFTASAITINAIDKNTVQIVYSGATASVTVASNISSYITVSSGTSSHVKIVQAANFAGVDATTSNSDGEIIYALSGTTSDGEFYLEGSFKCTVELDGVSITNTSGPAINIQNGKRIEVSAKKGTVNTLTDAANDAYNGCYNSKGHTKFKGKGTLNVMGNSRHAIYSKEYVEVKNLTLNITSAPKDGIHCKEYFLMESGTVKISGAKDDGIQVELSGTTSTGQTADHDDEDTGNFYMADGTLTISGYSGKAIKADGTINYSGGTRNFSTTDTEQLAGISELTTTSSADSSAAVFDLNGRQLKQPQPGTINLVRRNGRYVKVFVK